MISSPGEFHKRKKKKGNDDECIIDVLEDDFMLQTYEPEVEEAFWKRQSIYKLHNYIKQRNENIYDPLLVSIGPYHHGKEQLKPLETHKRRAFHHFTNRSGVPIQEYKNALMSEVIILKECYDQLDHKYWNDSKFIELMIVDGCFILEFMDVMSGTPKDYAQNDPIFSYYGCFIHYRCMLRDFLLLENQLPYLVLERLVEVSQLNQSSPQSVHVILSQMMMFNTNMDPGRHMLDMYMRGLFQGSSGPEAEITHLSASLLDQAGIQFKKIHSFMDISFNTNTATLNLPPININDYSISTFMNLKAFELRGTTTRDFNSYLQLMDSLIETDKDVKLLESKGIVVNYLRSGGCVVKLVKDLAKDTVVDKNCNSYIALKSMNKHYDEIMKQWKNGLKRRMVEWILNLQQTYFSNPWSSISVVAAACLLVLTILQTIYTIRSFYKQK